MDSKITSTEVDVTVRTREGMTIEDVKLQAAIAIRRLPQFKGALILGDIPLEIISVERE
jgi:hypothetical protein